MNWVWFYHCWPQWPDQDLLNSAVWIFTWSAVWEVPRPWCSLKNNIGKWYRRLASIMMQKKTRLYACTSLQCKSQQDKSWLDVLKWMQKQFLSLKAGPWYSRVSNTASPSKIGLERQEFHGTSVWFFVKWMASYSHKHLTHIIQLYSHFSCFDHDDVTCAESHKNAAPCPSGDDSILLLW